MNGTNELHAQQLNEEAVRLATRILLFAGVQTQDAAIVYSNVRETLEAVLQEIERRGFGFDAAHPDNFEYMIEGLKDTLDDRIEKHRW